MANFIHISEAALLAMHAVSLLARQPSKSMNVKTLAEKMKASANHISKVMQHLVKTGCLKSNRGPSGGFTLLKEPKDIKLLDIYEAIEGKLIIERCPFHKDKCIFDKCIFDSVFIEIEKKFTNYLKTTTVVQ